MTKVNASYQWQLNAACLAAKIVDPSSASSFNASVFAFFSEVSLADQLSFIEEMNVDLKQAVHVARMFASRSGFPLDLVVQHESCPERLD